MHYPHRKTNRCKVGQGAELFQCVWLWERSASRRTKVQLGQRSNEGKSFPGQKRRAQFAFSARWEKLEGQSAFQ